MTDARKKYLRGLAEDYGLSTKVVYAIADMLGEAEDYDGLIVHLNELEFVEPRPTLALF